MGFELWYSETTKISRKGTTFSELQNIFINNITTKFIYEPLACCKVSDNVIEVKRTLDLRDFDTLGVVDDSEKKIGYIIHQELQNGKILQYVRPFETDILISDSTPICDLLDILSEKEYVYVLDKNSIEGIVTRADINKPIVRIYLFGIISLFELHLNYWINKNYIESEWEAILPKKRITTAHEIYTQRKGNNSQLTILECIQICDKKFILMKCITFLKIFQYSKNKFKDLLENSENIRNELAHSQSSIIANLDWKKFVLTISAIKEFLEQSEKKIKT
ncbi:CBS domain-containing protein [Flavobacterium sp. '19STA2R22 D10 B1']|uniref:CBS domain-containing protein n=1 Tax=Flavobacterium aerium TaxID=3037261 RepID=UPI00278C7C82|nr:CBS domain-containing protein [Flavobacterium sp. '19STA2R22 D10 B1']